MDTKHLFAEGYYEISNKAVAKCFLFKKAEDCIKFKQKIENTLTPICDILAFGFQEDEFRLVVRLKSRKTFETYFRSKYENQVSLGDLIPETTYIFAQAMSNLQSGYVKWFNFKYKRDGGLMCGRYKRRLIEDETELEKTIASINELCIQKQRTGIWTYRRKGTEFKVELVKKSVIRSSWSMYNGGAADAGLLGFNHSDKVYVRGHFDNLPPKQLLGLQSSEKLANLLSFMFLKLKR